MAESDHQYENNLEQNEDDDVENEDGDVEEENADEEESEDENEEEEEEEEEVYEEESEYENEEEEEEEEYEDEGESEDEEKSEEKNGDEKKEEESQENVWNRSEVDGLFCPICMEPWTSQGDHQVSCLSCGHIYGLSCITKWMERKGNSAKCPQCNRKFRLKDIRILFAPRIAAVDEESQKRIQYLEAKCTTYVKQLSKLRRRESLNGRRSDKLESDMKKLQSDMKWCSEIMKNLDHMVKVLQNRTSCSCWSSKRPKTSGNFVNATSDNQGSCGSFVFQRELQVDGAQLFDINALDNQLLLAQKQKMGESDILTKVSLAHPHEKEDVFLPSGTKIIKDLHISPFNGDLALFVSLRKEISIISMKSNNVILSYDLPVPAWSCSWDTSSPNYIYAGLENGSLLVFDMRQTKMPVESRSGLSTYPIHTIHSLQHDPSLPSGIRTVLSASSDGVCRWSFNGGEERPLQVTETMHLSDCVALAHCPVNNNIVASYRSRAEMPEATAASKKRPTLSSSLFQTNFHVHMKSAGNNFERVGIGYGALSETQQLPRTTIVSIEKEKPLFVTGEEFSNTLILQELPSFAVAQQFKSHKHFISDVKFRSTSSKGLLGCLSEDTLQLYCTKLP